MMNTQEKITRAWIQQFVIDLNLCPFAGVPFRTEKIRYRLEVSSQEEDLVQTLLQELLLLTEKSASEIETTLIIHPNVLTHFMDYNDFVGLAEDILVEAGLEGDIQVASFHPDYQFAETNNDAPENYTNRSPFPMLHLLREESIDKALQQYEKPEMIPQRNIETMQKLGLAAIIEKLRSINEKEK